VPGRLSRLVHFQQQPGQLEPHPLVGRVEPDRLPQGVHGLGPQPEALAHVAPRSPRPGVTWSELNPLIDQRVGPGPAELGHVRRDQDRENLRGLRVTGGQAIQEGVLHPP
jgi:hypothetical protein